MDAFKVHGKNLAKNPKGKEQAELIAGKPEVLVMEALAPPGLKAGTAGLAIVAEIPVKDVSGFSEASRSLIDAVHQNEAGNLLYCFAKHPSGKSVVATELYTDKEAIQLHSSSAHFKAGGQAQGPFLAGAPTMSVLKVVEGAGLARPAPQAKL